MDWQRRSMGLLVRRLRRNLRQPRITVAGLSTGQVGLEIFQAERPLVRIKPYGAVAELWPLELLDDGPQALDLDPAWPRCLMAGNNTCKIVHQLL